MISRSSTLIMASCRARAMSVRALSTLPLSSARAFSPSSFSPVSQFQQLSSSGPLRALSSSVEHSQVVHEKSLADFVSEAAASQPPSSSSAQPITKDPRLNVFSITQEDLESLLIELGYPKFHAKSIFHSLYTLGISDFSQMTSLPLKLREVLDSRIKFGTLTVMSEEISKDGTIKRAYALEDGQLIESVLMPYKDGRFTVCISSQAGCAMGCKFCATGQMGFSRQLRADEINEQLFRFFSLLKNHGNTYHEKLSKVDRNFKEFLRYNEVNDDFYQFYEDDDAPQTESQGGKKKKAQTSDAVSAPAGKAVAQNAFPSYRMSNIVFMGMGEPLLNYENVKRSLEFITQRLKISGRSVTISTVGIAPRIKLLASEIKAKTVPSVNLAVSLHFASDAERERFMPVNKKYDLAELMQSVRFFAGSLNKRISFEWALIRGISDTEEVADKLGTFLRGMRNVHVNLIPLNPTTKFDEKASSKDDVDRFINILAEYRIPATVRVRRGIDISAGCGQLKAKVMRTRGKFQTESSQEDK